MPEPCRVDLSKIDTYPDDDIPDDDVETCLKVLRTLRNAALGADTFHAEAAVILSHAHATIVEMVQGLQKEQAPQAEPTCELCGGKMSGPACPRCDSEYGT